eukprot:Stramenopile-MAST_4_protein_4470
MFLKTLTTKRVARERTELEEMPKRNPQFSVESVKNDLEWTVRITVPSNAHTPYAGLSTCCLLSFPEDYPFLPPTVRFTPPVYHPEIFQSTGKVHMDLLMSQWDLSRNLGFVLSFLYNIFLDIDGKNSVDVNIMHLLNKDRPSFDKSVREYVLQHQQKQLESQRLHIKRTALKKEINLVAKEVNNGRQILEGLESRHKFADDPIDLKELESRMETIQEETAQYEARLLSLRRALTADKL